MYCAVKINGLSQSNITKGDNAKSKKGRIVILVRDTSSGPVLHFCQVPSKYSKWYSSYNADTKSFLNKIKGDNCKSKKARVVNFVCDTSSHPDLHFYQVSLKYFKGYSSYRVNKKFYADADANLIRPKNNISHHPPPPQPPPPPCTPLVWGVGGHQLPSVLFLRISFFNLLLFDLLSISPRRLLTYYILLLLHA